MYELTFDLGIVLLSLLVLFSASRRRNRHFEFQPQSRKAMTAGAALLAAAGAINLACALVLDQVGWGGVWPQILRAAGTAAFLGGCSLLALGLIGWWGSLVRAKSAATRRLRQLACLKALLTETHRHGELDEMLKACLSQLMNVMGYQVGVMYRPTFRSSEMTLVAHAGVPIKNVFHLYELHLKNVWYREAQSSAKVTTTSDLSNLPECGKVFFDRDGLRSLACVPITFSGKTLGLLGLYDNRADRFSYQEIQFLTSVGEMLGLAAKRSLASMKSKRRRDYISAMENILAAVGQSDSLEDAFSKLSLQIKRVIDFHHLTLILAAGPMQNARAISVGESGGVLVERGADFNLGRGKIGEAMGSGAARVDGDISPGESSEEARFGAWGVRSRIILPLRAEGFFRGAVCLGHKQPHFYSAADAEWLRPLTLMITQIIVRDELKRQMEKEKTLTRSARDFDGKLAGDEELLDLVGDVASSLVADLPRSFARVTLLSKKKDQLLNCASQQIRSGGIRLANQARFSLEELPWHRLTLEARRPMLINQSDPESLMSAREAQTVMDRRIGSAFLVPVMLEGKAVGIISLGEMRQWDRQPLTRQEMDFVRHKADQLSLALKEALLRRSNRHLCEKLARLEMADKPRRQRVVTGKELSELSYQVANPLTSIRGSAELLRLRQPELDPDCLRYLSNIERGVDRIQESFEKFLDRTKPGTGPEGSEVNDLKPEEVTSDALLT